MITDPTQMPKQFSEAPQLAELVKAGKLPAVQERVGQEPLVVKPLKDIGKYGGTWRRGFTGPGDQENGNRINSEDKILFWDYTGTKNAPSVARSWDVGDGGRTITISLRKGMKWSDGQPFNADDFMFWFDDIYLNKQLVPNGTTFLLVNGKPGKMEKVDDVTVRWVFPDPNPMFVDILSGSDSVGGGLASQGSGGMGSYAPAHYLKQFLPKYAGQDKVDQMTKAAKYTSWTTFFLDRMNWALNPQLPMLTPWVTTTPINTPTWTLSRNPYYWAVDTAGNQLPYIDQIVMTLANDLETLNLRAIAGEYDWQERNTDLQKLPVFLQNEKKGNYTVHLDPSNSGSDAAIQINQSYNADQEIAKWLTNVDFRRALSLGIDRDQLNQSFWLGLGTPGSIVSADDNPYNPGPQYRTLWSTYKPDTANQMLDKIGLTRKDSDGFRVRTDGKGRLRLAATTYGGSFLNFAGIMQMVGQQWQKIGIQLDVQELERSLVQTRITANQDQLTVFVNDGLEQPFLFPVYWFPVTPSSADGPLYGLWYASGGKAGVKPTDPQMLKAQQMISTAAGLAAEDRYTLGKEIWKIVIDQQWTIGTVGLSPAQLGVRVVKNNLGNVPAREVNA
ncbi:MAG: ABC transporter substrate-binding protein, partial [Candidatus Dormibacteraceae bacterium]